MPNVTLPGDGSVVETVDGAGGAQRQVVQVANLPATQTVAGTVAVSNLPATQPVSGSVSVSNLPATQAVSGTVAVSNFPATGLTDAQLRAAAVPVSFTDNGLTNTQLRASAVPVSGAVAIDQTTGGTTNGVQINALTYPNSTANNSTAQLGAGITFTGGVETILSLQAAQIMIRSDQSFTLQVFQYIDAAGTQLIATLTFTRAANVPLNENITLPGNYFKLAVTNNGASATTNLVIATTFGIMDTQPQALTNLGFFPVAINEVGGTAIAGSLPTSNASVSASGNITTQNLVPAGAATANSAVEITLAGSNALTAQVTGTYTGALSLQATIDGTNWITLGGTPLLNINTGGYLASITSALQSIFQCEVGAFQKARITGLAAMTGTATVTLRATSGASAMVALDNAIPAGANTIGAVNIAATQTLATVTTVGTVTTVSSSTPVTPTQTFTNSAATTNATTTKASAGTVWSVTVSNINAAARFLKLYNKASAPTVGTDVPVMTLPIPAGGLVQWDGGANGMRFSTGIAWALTGLAADTDTTVVAVSEHKVAIAFT